MPKIKMTSLENSSVLRKFTIFYVLMSVLPVGVIYYFYLDIKDQGKLSFTASDISITLLFLVTGALVGFLCMRKVLKNIIDITNSSRSTLEEVLGPERIGEIANNNNEIALLARSFSEITNRLEENVRNLELAKKTLHSVLSKVGKGISSMENIDSFLDLIVETVAEALSAKIGVLMLIDQEKNELYVKTVHGITYDTKASVRFKMEESPFTAVLKTKKPVIIPKLEGVELTSGDQGPLFETPVLCAPLLIHDKVLGTISVCGKRKDEGFKDDELNLLYNLALQTAVAIENASLNENAEKTYFETISALALAVEAKDQYSRGHLDRVAEYALRIGRKLNLPAEDMKILHDGARLHDLGKIGILDDILKKQASLTEQEWKIMQKHPEIGEGIIKPIRSLSKLCDVIRHHHEKLDGSGYPDGLKGDEISLLARILCVADIFDALTTDRPYRKAFSLEQAKEELKKMSETKLDPKIVNTFLETI